MRLNPFGLLICILLTAFLNRAEAIESDKTLHAYGGIVVGLTTTMITKDAHIGCLASVSIGAGKEMADQYFDTLDFLYTAGWGCLSSYAFGAFIIYSDKHRSYIGIRLNR